MQLSIPHRTVQFPMTKNCPASNVSSAEVEKPCPRIHTRSGLKVGWYCVFTCNYCVRKGNLKKEKKSETVSML